MRGQVLESLHVEGVHEPELDRSIGHELFAVLPAGFPGAKIGEEKEGCANEPQGCHEERVHARQGAADQTEGKGPNQGSCGEIRHESLTCARKSEELLPAVGCP